MEIINEESNKPRRIKGMGFGVLMIVIGTVLLGLNFGLINESLRWVFFSWPSLIILVGIMHMVKKHQIIWGVLWVIVGFFFLLPKIVRAFPDFFPNGIAENFTSAYWPVLFIFFGLVVVLNKYFFPVKEWRNKIETKFQHHHDYHRQAYGYKRSGAFEKNSIFGGGEHIILDPEFKGGEINSVFGGLTLDLRRTNLPEGETVLDMNAVFGGVTLFIPGNWFVETRVDAVFGGFEDKRFIQEPIDKSRKLIIVGSCVFGGGEILS